MTTNKNKHPKLTAFAIAIPDSNTMLQGHINPLKLPLGYVLQTMGKIDAQPQPQQTIVYQMQNN